MATRYKKVNYVCECGIDFGSCGRPCSFVLVSYETTDHIKIYHRGHNNDGSPGNLEPFGSILSSEAESALGSILAGTAGSKTCLSEADIEELKKFA